MDKTFMTMGLISYQHLVIISVVFIAFVAFLGLIVRKLISKKP